MRIEDLGICPLAFANPQVFETLKMRGQKFWALLNENSESHVNYKGWNTQRDEYLVSYETKNPLHMLWRFMLVPIHDICLYATAPSIFISVRPSIRKS